jgi:hypothetical protein
VKNFRIISGISEREVRFQQLKPIGFWNVKDIAEEAKDIKFYFHYHQE